MNMNVGELLRQMSGLAPTNAYESLRADVVQRGTNQQTLGQQLFCQRGMVAWLVEWCPRIALPARSRRPPPVEPVVLMGKRDELTPIIASIVQLALAGLVA